MRIVLSSAVLGALLLLPGATALGAPVSLERELRYDARRFSAVEKNGETRIEMSGAGREFVPGRPDLPIVGEMIEIPAGMRVVGVEVTSLASAELSRAARVPTAAKASHELGPIERTEPDPAFYRRAGFAPTSEQAVLGYQGWMRGRHIAALRVSPVRWDAASGRLERIERMTVRLKLESAVDPDVVPRERIVPEWEDGFVGAPGAGASAEPSRPAQPFKPTQVPSVLGSPVAYVIITTDPLAAEFQRLADWKTQSGVPAVVRTLSFVRQEYPFGTDDADRIRQFIRDAYGRWGTKWVLLGGDTEVIPHRNIFNTFFGGETIPCDMYFSCLDGNWNADGDSTYGEGVTSEEQGDASDMLPEVYVGRAPVVSVAEVQRFVNKNFQYTRTPVGDYEHQLMFFAEVVFPQDWQPGQITSLDGASIAQEMLPSLNLSPDLRYLRLYQNYLDPSWAPGPLPETSTAVIDSFNAGYNMAIHVGHGYRNVLGCGEGTIENAEALAWTNGNRLSNLYSIGCNGSSIDFPCIAEAFLNAPAGGAVSYIGSTRVDFPSVGRDYDKEYFRLLYEVGVTAVGEAQAKQKLPFAAASVGDNIFRWTTTTLLLLGDPELHQWTATPRTLNVSHPSSYALSDSTMLVNVATGGSPLAGARVTLHKPGDDYRSVLTNGAGNALVEFRPGSTGTFYVTVTAFDCRPRQDTLTVGAAAAAVLADFGTPIIDDDNLSGTSGNGNGILDAGEIVDLQIPVINRGGATATGVNGVLTTTDGLIAITDADVGYGTLVPTASSNGTSAFRLTIPYTCPDQREVPLKLELVTLQGRHFVHRLSLTTRSPEPRHFAHTITDAPGNGNGIPEAGETVTMIVTMRNIGTGTASAVTAKLRDYDGLATVTDSTASFGTLAPGQQTPGDALVYSVGSTAARLELRISNASGLLSTHVVDLVRPATPTDLAGAGNQTSISLVWARNAAADLAGYNIYRSSTLGGSYVKVNTLPTDRTSYYLDEGLTPLTRYYYKVTAVDSSGNESALSTITDCSTNPPNHTLFPIEMRQQTPAPVAIDYVYQHSMMDIFAGSDVVWAWHADGTAPVDADGTAVTHGDFTTRGRYYAAGVSLAALDGNNWSIIAPSWDSTRVYVFDKLGNVRPGWPFVTDNAVWSGVAVGDLDNDGSRELVFGSNGQRFYALRADGTEWIDGDANPGTPGVFKVLASEYNYGTPALADIDGNGELDIVYAAFEGKLFVWRPSGSNLPGFPVNIGLATTSSPAIGYLDGAGDTQPDIVVTSHNDSLYVFKPDGGRRTGFPVGARFNAGTDKNPSPALADMDLDGYLDIIVASSDGRIYVYDRNGVLHPSFANCRFSAITSGFATQNSPTVADISGDGLPDIVIGDENGVLNGISGTGEILPGFPIQLGGEVRGGAALCDCDGDGMSEIVVSSWDEKTYVWDYDQPFSPGGPPPWPQFHHDARRTGLTTSPVFLDAGDPVRPGAAAVLELSRPEPNPARAAARIRWIVPAGHDGADLDLSVYDLAGRRLATLASGRAREGRFTREWDLRAGDAGRVGSGIYFVRLRLGTTTMTQKLAVMP